MLHFPVTSGLSDTPRPSFCLKPNLTTVPLSTEVNLKAMDDLNKGQVDPPPEATPTASESDDSMSQESDHPQPLAAHESDAGSAIGPEDAILEDAPPTSSHPTDPTKTESKEKSITKPISDKSFYNTPTKSSDSEKWPLSTGSLVTRTIAKLTDTIKNIPLGHANALPAPKTPQPLSLSGHS